jgi:integrase
MQDLQARDGIAADALEFQILTAVRPGNALKARWTEFDLKAAEWTIAEEDMKGEKGEETEHKVPLSAAALAVLDRMAKIRNGEYVFFSDSGRPLSDMAQGALIDRMNQANVAAGKPKWLDPRQKREIVPHGFRSSFRDWAAENGCPDAVAEACLAHKISDAVVAAYLRTDFPKLRRHWMDRWATFATSDPASVNNVVPLRASDAVHS